MKYMNSFNPSDITDQYVLNTRDNFQKELHRVMTQSHNSTENVDDKREKDLQKHITLLNSLVIQLLKYKNFKRVLAQRI